MNSDSRNSNTQALIEQVKSCLQPMNNNNTKDILNLPIETNEIHSRLSTGNKQLSSIQIDQNINDDIRALLSDLVVNVDKKLAEISSPVLVEFQ